MESASSWRFFVAIKKAKILEKVKRLGPGRYKFVDLQD